MFNITLPFILSTHLSSISSNSKSGLGGPVAIIQHSAVTYTSYHQTKAKGQHGLVTVPSLQG